MRVLFCCLGSHGYVYPAIGIALELRARGHEVAFVTVSAFEPILTAQGFERIALPEIGDRGFPISGWGDPLTLKAQVWHTRHALKYYQPDVVVTNQLAIAPMALCAAERRPLAVLGFGGFPFPTSTEMLSTPKSPAEKELVARFELLTGILSNTLRLAGFNDLGTDARTIDKTPLFGDICLVQSVPELASLELPPRVRLIGSCLWEPVDHDSNLCEWLKLEPTVPLVYVQPSRTFGGVSFWPTFVAVARRRLIRVAASTSRMDGPAAESPCDRFFLRPHVPQGKVLPFARGVICSATTTPVLGALTHGIPCFMLPAGSAQPELSSECERAGVGFSLDAKAADAASLEQAVDRLLSDPLLQSQARRMREAFATIHGPRTAAILIEGIRHAN